MAVLAQATYVVKRAAKDGYSLSLSPESVILPADSSGNVTDYSGAKTTVQLSCGDKTILPSSAAGSQDIIGILSTYNCTATKTTGAGITVTNVTGETAYVDIPVRYEEFQAVKRFLLTVVRDGERGEDLASGKMLYRDPTFKSGVNSTAKYNTSGGTTTAWTRTAKSSDCPTDSDYMMRYAYAGGGSASPGFGGFFFGNTSRANAVFVTKIIAKIPVGRTINWATNQTGDGRKQEWLTSVNGTGKFETYLCKVTCGVSGTFSTTNFFYFSGGTNAAFDVDVAYATVIDMMLYDDTYDTKFTQTDKQIALNASAISSAQGDISVLAGRVSEAELKITPDAIKLTVKSQTETIADTAAANAAKRYAITVDATALDNSKYYPITIGMKTTTPYTITVARDLAASMGLPSWGTHSSGFSVLCKWTSNGSGWGAIAVKRVVHTFAYLFASVLPVGSIGQMTNSSKEYIYVRGGSKYNVTVEGTTSTDVVLRTEAYTASSQTIDALSSVTQPVADIDQRPTTETIKSEFTMDSSGVSILGKKIAFTGVVTFSALAADAQGKITTAQSTADTANSGLSTLKTSLKSLAYLDAVGLAKLDSTIIEGGYVKTSLINADAIITSSLLAGKIAATDITTGRLTVTDGSKIAGLKVSGNSLTNEGFNNDAYIILRHDNYNTFVGIGANVWPSTSPVYGTGRFEIGRSSSYKNIALYASAANSSNENVALYMAAGWISGFAVKCRQISVGTTLTHEDTIISCYNSATINIYLPSSPQVGKIIMIIQVNSASVNVYGNGKSIFRSGVVRNPDALTNRGETGFYMYDGQYWHNGWLNH